MNEEARKHHPYSPSTLASLECCPCFQSRQNEVQHERTIAGTRAHKAVETGQDDDLLSDDDAVSVAECLDLIARRKLELETKNLPEDLIGKAVNMVDELKEAYLPIDDLIFREAYQGETGLLWDTIKSTTAGYVDHVLICSALNHAELLDWKFGRWSVECAEKNLQGIAYALGLFYKYPELQTITVWFKLPTIGAITSATFTREQIPALYLRVTTVVARAREARQQNDFSSANPTHPTCAFCSNLGRCPAVAKFALKVGSKFHKLAVPEDTTPGALRDPAQSKLALELASVMAVWAKAVRGQVTDQILRGVSPTPEGYKISTFSKREVIDEAKFKSVALLFVKAEDYAALQDAPGFGKLEDLISERAPRGQKKNAVETFAQQLLDAGAVVEGPAYPFLKAVPVKETET